MSSSLSGLGEAIRGAYETADLEAFAALLHPDVSWGEGPIACRHRDEVVAWYRRALERGLRAEATSVEARNHSLVLTIDFSGRSEGTDPTLVQTSYQVLHIDGGRVVEIVGYDDLAAAQSDANHWRPSAATTTR